MTLLCEKIVLSVGETNSYRSAKIQMLKLESKYPLKLKIYCFAVNNDMEQLGFSKLFDTNASFRGKKRKKKFFDCASSTFVLSPLKQSNLPICCFHLKTML